MSLHPYVWI